MKAKHICIRFSYLLWGGVASCGAHFLGSNFCNFNSISSVVLFLNEKLMVLSTDDCIVMMLGCVP